MKDIYPVILTPAEKGYVIFVPDLDINTEGNDLSDALDMARDAICIWAESERSMGRSIPKPSNLTPGHKKDEICTLVDVDFEAYRRANENRTIRKNVTLPSWLNVIAEQNNINFSGVLQEALIDKLHLNQ